MTFMELMLSIKQGTQPEIIYFDLFKKNYYFSDGVYYDKETNNSLLHDLVDFYSDEEIVNLHFKIIENKNMQKDLNDLKTNLIDFCRKYDVLISDIQTQWFERNIDGSRIIESIELEIRK